MTEEELSRIEFDASCLIPDGDALIAHLLEDDVPKLIAEIRRYRNALSPDYDIDDIPDLIQKAEYWDEMP